MHAGTGPRPEPSGGSSSSTAALQEPAAALLPPPKPVGSSGRYDNIDQDEDPLQSSLVHGSTDEDEDTDSEGDPDLSRPVASPPQSTRGCDAEGSVRGEADLSRTSVQFWIPKPATLRPGTASQQRPSSRMAVVRASVSSLLDAEEELRMAMAIDRAMDAEMHEDEDEDDRGRDEPSSSATPRCDVDLRAAHSALRASQQRIRELRQSQVLVAAPQPVFTEDDGYGDDPLQEADEAPYDEESLDELVDSDDPLDSDEDGGSGMGQSPSDLTPLALGVAKRSALQDGVPLPVAGIPDNVKLCEAGDHAGIGATAREEGEEELGEAGDVEEEEEEEEGEDLEGKDRPDLDLVVAGVAMPIRMSAELSGGLVAVLQAQTITEHSHDDDEGDEGDVRPDLDLFVVGAAMPIRQSVEWPVGYPRAAVPAGAAAEGGGTDGTDGGAGPAEGEGDEEDEEDFGGGDDSATEAEAQGEAEAEEALSGPGPDLLVAGVALPLRPGKGRGTADASSSTATGGAAVGVTMDDEDDEGEERPDLDFVVQGSAMPIRQSVEWAAGPPKSMKATAGDQADDQVADEDDEEDFGGDEAAGEALEGEDVVGEERPDLDLVVTGTAMPIRQSVEFGGGLGATLAAVVPPRATPGEIAVPDGEGSDGPAGDEGEARPDLDLLVTGTAMPIRQSVEWVGRRPAAEGPPALRASAAALVPEAEEGEGGEAAPAADEDDEEDFGGDEASANAEEEDGEEAFGLEEGDAAAPPGLDLLVTGVAMPIRQSVEWAAGQATTLSSAPTPAPEAVAGEEDDEGEARSDLDLLVTGTAMPIRQSVEWAAGQAMALGSPGPGGGRGVGRTKSPGLDGEEQEEEEEEEGLPGEDDEEDFGGDELGPDGAAEEDEAEDEDEDEDDGAGDAVARGGAGTADLWVAGTAMPIRQSVELPGGGLTQRISRVIEEELGPMGETAAGTASRARPGESEAEYLSDGQDTDLTNVQLQQPAEGHSAAAPALLPGMGGTRLISRALEMELGPDGEDAGPPGDDYEAVGHRAMDLQDYAGSSGDSSPAQVDAAILRRSVQQVEALLAVARKIDEELGPDADTLTALDSTMKERGSRPPFLDTGDIRQLALEIGVDVAPAHVTREDEDPAREGEINLLEHEANVEDEFPVGRLTDGDDEPTSDDDLPEASEAEIRQLEQQLALIHRQDARVQDQHVEEVRQSGQFSQWSLKAASAHSFYKDVAREEPLRSSEAEWEALVRSAEVDHASAAAAAVRLSNQPNDEAWPADSPAAEGGAEVASNLQDGDAEAEAEAGPLRAGMPPEERLDVIRRLEEEYSDFVVARPPSAGRPAALSPAALAETEDGYAAEPDWAELQSHLPASAPKPSPGPGASPPRPPGSKKAKRAAAAARRRSSANPPEERQRRRTSGVGSDAGVGGLDLAIHGNRVQDGGGEATGSRDASLPKSPAQGNAGTPGSRAGSDGPTHAKNAATTRDQRAKQRAEAKQREREEELAKAKEDYLERLQQREAECPTAERQRAYQLAVQEREQREQERLARKLQVLEEKRLQQEEAARKAEEERRERYRQAKATAAERDQRERERKERKEQQRAQQLKEEQDALLAEKRRAQEMQAEHRRREQERAKHEEDRRVAALKRREERQQQEQLEKAKLDEEHQRRREKYLRSLAAMGLAPGAHPHDMPSPDHEVALAPDPAPAPAPGEVQAQQAAFMERQRAAEGAPPLPLRRARRSRDDGAGGGGGGGGGPRPGWTTAPGGDPAAGGGEPRACTQPLPSKGPATKCTSLEPLDALKLPRYRKPPAPVTQPARSAKTAPAAYNVERLPPILRSILER